MGSKFFPVRVTPKLEVIQLAPVKNKNDFFFHLSEGMENCKISGKSQGILRWMISGNPGIPVFHTHALISLPLQKNRKSYCNNAPVHIIVLISCFG